MEMILLIAFCIGLGCFIAYRLDILKFVKTKIKGE